MYITKTFLLKVSSQGRVDINPFEYILKWVIIMKTAKLFQNGQSQAVRLPKEFRFEGEEVYIKKSWYLFTTF